LYVAAAVQCSRTSQAASSRTTDVPGAAAVASARARHALLQNLWRRRRTASTGRQAVLRSSRWERGLFSLARPAVRQRLFTYVHMEWRKKPGPLMAPESEKVANISHGRRFFENEKVPRTQV